MHSATAVHSSQLAFTRSLQLGGGGGVVVSSGMLLVVASVVVALSAGDTVVSAAGVDSKLADLPFSAGVLLLLLLLVESWSLGSPETDAKAPSINARQKVFMFR